jgi:hypothetical protein
MAWLTGKVGAQAEPAGAPGAATPPAPSTSGRTSATSTSRRRGRTRSTGRPATSSPATSSPATTQRAFATGSAPPTSPTRRSSWAGGRSTTASSRPWRSTPPATAPSRRVHVTADPRSSTASAARRHHVPQRLRRVINGVPHGRGRRLHRHGRQRHAGHDHLRHGPRGRRPRQVRYFTTAAKAYPQAVHASNIVKPGAVRGRNIVVSSGRRQPRQRLSGVQTLRARGDRRVRGRARARQRGARPGASSTAATAPARSRSAQGLRRVHRAAGQGDGRRDRPRSSATSTRTRCRWRSRSRTRRTRAQILKTLYVSDGVFQPRARRRA